MPKGIFKRKPHTKETKEKQRQSALNRPSFTEKHKERMREAHLKNPTRYWSGKKRPPFSEEWKKKISKGTKGKNNPMYGIIGKNHWNWQGGKSFEPYSVDWTDDLKESIRKRDDYVCQTCGIHQDELVSIHKKLDVHHIDYDKDNLNPKNLISLCKSCHMKTNYNREYWINIF
uniref:HNH nuclease domain-containing protein n=1 Tax=viral metagenome TaxID=1070528 RepID=A0A6M3L718_9ZZZZ